MSAVQPPTHEQIAPLPDDARMDAYYYGFERTGVGFIDAILSAVAIAGKASHHTESWGAPWEGTTDYFRGHSGLPDAEDAVDLIQKAAQQAADAVLALSPQPTPRAEPMAPGTTFIAPYPSYGGGFWTVREGEDELIAATHTGDEIPLRDFDPSSMRDVTPPPATPETDR
jgi:hypothetical protein